ncbi:hypothetical protein GDO81_007407 [Engystomops pustulosus]|uniref:pre-mRNA 3' end processing protein WDR33 n=2 Tax=Engystomops pustulosus TaxID=76066 RepID=A0AAV7C6Y1_ENGPU|nr:hypothetical protein GDO81_007407 [Engystomops pustulosus]KAG8580750.1 hypothetical protein GDO81_007407 [Engystomops pustulosus]KAG8580751.1 hypothetical protein GDO81_007407 [Engystomops pustulosus]KAG8580752.1 hypothetical protein GDO81_007407 [Engystomops pustulosus]KAG8580753.1 hypothetical protein GDO81_007407 [Engystomops pustulosus]
MATEIGSPPRFFHMPRFQHQAPRQLFYKRPDYAQQQAMQQLTFDGKRMRKAVNRKTIDYNPSVIKYLENRVWQRDQRDMRAIQPDAGYYNDLVPPIGMLNNPLNAVTTKFVRTSTNKVKCPVFVVRWTPEGRRLVTGASSGEFTLWNGLTFNFETILQAHDSPVRAMTWSHNDMWMLTADHSGYVKYWQSNMNNVKMFQAHKEAIREASFSPTDNKFATCSDDGTVRIWDFLRCHEERILRGHGADVKCVDWHPTKGLLVSGSKDSQQPIKFWDPKNGQSLATLHAHKNTVMEVKWNLNGNWLLTASRDHLCKLFDIRNLREELQVFRGHKKEATAVAWHPVHEGLFASGGSDGSLLFWNVGVEKEVGGMEIAHEGMIWSLAWHPLGHILCSGSNDHTSKFWTRNRPGDKMRDRYNLNLLAGMSEDGVEYDDVEPNNLAVIPGMGIPEQLKMAMEQEQIGKEESNSVEMTIPGLDWGMDEVMQKDQKKVPQKKVPYAKPIPAQFQQAWLQNKVPLMPPSEAVPERKEEVKTDEKKKNQAEIEQEMAALQYTNPQLLEQLKIERIAQKQAEAPGQSPGLASPLGAPPQGSSAFSASGPQSQPPLNFQQPHPSQPMAMNMQHGPQGQFRPQGPQVSAGPQGFMGPGPQNLRPQEMHPGMPRLSAPVGPMGPQGPPGNPGAPGHLAPQIPQGNRGVPPPHHGMQGGPGPQGPLMGVAPRGVQQGPNQGMLMGHPAQDLRGPSGAMHGHGPDVRGPMDMRGPSDMRGPQDMRGPPEMHGPQDMRGLPDMRGPQDMRGPLDIHGPQDIRAPDLRGPQDMRGLSDMHGSVDMRGPPDMRGPHDMRGPLDMRGPHDMRGPPDVRGLQDMRGPLDMRGPPDMRGGPDMRGPPDMRGGPDMRGPSEMRAGPDMRGPPDMRGGPEMRGLSEMRSGPDMRGPPDMRGGPQDMRGGPLDMRGSHDMRGPPDARGPQDMRRSDMRGPPDIRGQQHMRGAQDTRGASDMHMSPDIRSPQDIRGPQDMRNLQDVRGPPDMGGPHELRAPQSRGSNMGLSQDTRGQSVTQGPTGNSQGPHNSQNPTRASHQSQQKTPLLGDGPRPFNQGGKGQAPPPLLPGLGGQANAQGRPPPLGQGPNANKGDIRGPSNHPSERRREPSPFRGGPEWMDSRDNRGPSDRRGPHSEGHDRPDDYQQDDRYGPRGRDFDGRGAGPSLQDEKWRRGGSGPQFSSNHRDFPDRDGRDSSRWEGRRHSDDQYARDSDDARFRGQRDDNFRRSGPPRHEGRGSHGREGFSSSDDFGASDSFDKDEPGRGRDSSRGRGRGPQRETRKGLLPTPDQFSDRGPNHQVRDSAREPGPDHFQGSPHRDTPTPDGHSPASRERSSSLQGMDMASLPPRKRPWHDGPGTPDHRDMDPSLSDDSGKGPPSRSQRLSRSSSREQDEGSSRSNRGNWGRGGSGSSSNMNSQWRGGPRSSGSSSGGGRNR